MDTQIDFELKAPSPGAAIESSPANQFVTFSAGDKAYGVDVMAVREIRSWSPTVELPDAPFGARGVLDIRGSVVEVYDLSAILGGPMSDAKPGHVVLVVSMGKTNVGILVDSVSDIIFAEEADFRPAPGSGRDRSNAKVSGLVRQDDRLIAILNLQTLFPSSDETWVLE